MLNTETYVPRLARGSRAVFVKKDYPKTGEHCIVLDPVPNPSQRSINQWYDVRFDDRRLLRCQEKDLQPVGERPSMLEKNAKGGASS